MNAGRYRLVFSRVRSMLTAVAESARSSGRGPSSSLPCSRSSVASLLIAMLIFGWRPALVDAAGTLPAGVLPVPSAQFVSSGAASVAASGAQLTVTQSSQNAILRWDSFNISADATVRFKQPGSTAVALNRIFSADPSRIEGRLTANGQIYLINQNGIVFGNGAQVNVNSLVASTLNISDALFTAGLLSNQRPAEDAAFTPFANSAPSGAITVENGAQIRTQSGGRVLLLAPDVSNNGIIQSPDGQTILAAGTKVYVAASQDVNLRGFLVEVDNGGSASNLNLGQITAERGNVTLIGFAVNQNGLIRATTAVNANGSVRLLARDSVVPVDVAGGLRVPQGNRGGAVTVGAGARTEVLPDASDTATSQDSQPFNRSFIEMSGLSVHLGKNSETIVPGGLLTLTAQRGATFQSAGAAADPDAKVFLEDGSVVDVAGTTDAAIPMSRNSVAVELRGNELRDSPQLRNGPLRGKKVYVDARKGTPIADVSGYVAQIQRGVEERLATGGDISIRSEGSVVLPATATLDASGGQVRYLGGPLRTSKLVGADGHIYDIGVASPNVSYVGIADTFTVTSAKWGVSKTFSSPVMSDTFVVGYSEGRNAGSISVVGHAVVLDGTLRARANAGAFQRQSGSVPLGGRLVLGDAGQSGSASPDFLLPDVELRQTAAASGTGLTFSSPLSDLPSDVVLSAQKLMDGGFTRLEVYSNGRIFVPAETALTLAPGSWGGTGGSITTNALTLLGRQVDVAGSIKVPGGSIVLSTVQPVTSGSLDPADYLLSVRGTGRLDTSGSWVNDREAALRGSVPNAPLAINGGSVALTSIADLSLDTGSVINVSGAAWLDATGKLTPGNAGSIVLSSGRLGLTPISPQTSVISLGASLLGYAVGSGGSLSISTSHVLIDGSGGASGAGAVTLSPAFFRTGGFSSYTVNGTDGLSVFDGTAAAARVDSWIMAGNYQVAPSGTAMDRLVSTQTLPDFQRQPATLTLTANSKFFGDVSIGEGARVAVDAQGKISIAAGRQLTLLGTVEAPAGSITLQTQTADQTDAFLPGQSLWLGPDARILARGLVQLQPTVDGRRVGDVLPGGQITIDAGRGYLIAQPGSLVDVSGDAGILDLPVQRGGIKAIGARLVTSDAGSVRVSAQEGAVLAGSMRARGGAGGSSENGSFSFQLDPGFVGTAFPEGPRVLAILPAAPLVPIGLKPGDVVDSAAQSATGNTIDRVALVGGEMLQQAGFDRLAFAAGDTVEMRGGVMLSTRLSIAIDAPTIRMANSGVSNLSAAYVSLGNTSIYVPSVPVEGGGQLTVNARVIDLEGAFALDGVSNVLLRSQQDIRLKGVLLPTADTLGLPGKMMVAADLTLQARQIYPTTLSDFVLSVLDHDLTFAGNGQAGPVPLSAAGQLTASARRIEQDGVVRAPFGAITLSASESLTLGANSITSISGEGQVIPFGRTVETGRDYVYTFGQNASLPILSPQQKAIALSAPQVDLKSSATVKIGSSGDVQAYEFIFGPGGSKDILDQAVSPSSFAVLPGYAAPFAPYDYQEYKSSVAPALAVGDQIRLSGGGGLPGGVYTLLPARYALLPGAFLVTRLSNTKDFLASDGGARGDGSVAMAGTRLTVALDGSVIEDSRSSAYAVLAGPAVRQHAEYLLTTQNKFFAGQTGAQLPADAGRLSLSATSALTLDGAISATAGRGYRGGELDIAAPNLVIVGDSTSGIPAGSLALSAQTLTHAGVASLLLGGTRSRSGDTLTITPVAQSVTFENDANSVLAVPEILAVGTSIGLGDGASIHATAGNAPSYSAIVIPGDATLLRASVAGSVVVSRPSFDPAATTAASLVVGDKAAMTAIGSVAVDAPGSATIAGSADFSAPSLSVAATLLRVGEAVGDGKGLELTGALLERVAGAKRLELKAYQAIELRGDVALGRTDVTTSQPVSELITLDAPAVLGYGSADKSVIAGVVRLQNSSPTVGFVAPVLQPTGSLGIQASGPPQSAGDIVLGPGTISVQGFQSVALSASRQVLTTGTGGLAVQQDLDISAGRIAAVTGSNTKIAAGGRVRLLGGVPATDPAFVPPAGSGASLSIQASSIEVAGRIVLPSGRATLEATGPSNSGSVTVRSGAQIDLRGEEVQFDGSYASAPAGSLTLRSAFGDVTLELGSKLVLSGAAHGGDAGELIVSAVNGRFQSPPVVEATAASADDSGARYQIDVAHLDSFSDLAAMIAAAGRSASFDLRVRAAPMIKIASDDHLTAERITVAADQGSIEIGGILRSDSAAGGAIQVWAGKDVSLLSGSVIDASSSHTGVRPGQVVLGTAQGSIDVATGSVIAVGGDASVGSGQILLRAPRSGSNDVNVNELSGTITGVNQVIIEAFQVYKAAALTTSGPSVSGGDLNVSPTGDLFAATAAYMSAAQPQVQTRLGPNVVLRPGIEIQTPDPASTETNLALGSAWNLCGTVAQCSGGWRFGGQPGILTIRATGDVALNAALSDGFNGATASARLQAGPDWSYRIVAGADLSAANPLSVTALGASSTGSLTIGPGSIIRTGAGSIDLRARSDIVLADPTSVVYTAGEPGALAPGYQVHNYVEQEFGNTVFTVTPVFPTGGGDISLAAGRDIQAARSLQLFSDWLYRRTAGLQAGGDYDYINPQTSWWPRFNTFQQGIATLGGGSISVTAGRDVIDLSVSAPTNGQIGGAVNAAPDPSRIVIRGGGDVSVSAGRNIQGGTYYIAKGRGTIEAANAILAGSSVLGADSTTVVQPRIVLALGDAQVKVRARGDVEFETALNPTLITQPSIETSRSNSDSSAFSTYQATTLGPDGNAQSRVSAVTISSAAGDISLFNNQGAELSTAYPPLFGISGSTNADGLTAYPGQTTVAALQGGIDVRSGFNVFPDPVGNLRLLSARDIVVSGNIIVSDVRPETLPSIAAPAAVFGDGALAAGIGRFSGGVGSHSGPPLHGGDTSPIVIQSLAGSVTFQQLAFLQVPKPATISGGLDVVNLDFIGQNLGEEDITRIQAGRDIVSQSKNDAGVTLINNRAIAIGGPGRLDVIAGRTVDLGSSLGILSRGDLDNPFLPPGGASISVFAGFGQGVRYQAFIDRYYDPSIEDDALLATLQSQISQYMAALNSGSPESRLAAFKQLNLSHADEVAEFMRRFTGNAGLSATDALAQFRALPAEQQLAVILDTLFAELKQSGRDVAKVGSVAYARGYAAAQILFPPTAQASGDIDLFFSQIKTEQGGDINLLAPYGKINAGLANSSGFSKAASQLGILTISGGDIRSYVRSDFLVNQSRVFTIGGGDILIWSSDGNIDAGKGAKTASATPPPQLRVDAQGNFFLDATQSVEGSGIGVLLAKAGIKPGDVDLIAPKGEVNAGDAGIRVAGNLNIAALRVIGAENIQVGGSSVGVPVAVTAGVPATAAAAAAAASTTRAGEQAVQAESSNATRNTAEKPFIPSFISVEVTGFGEDDQPK